MSTTKVRISTPQKNKNKLWRRTATKGYGRKLRAAVIDLGGKVYPTESIVLLMKRAGIETPVFDKSMSEYSVKLKAQADYLEAAESASLTPDIIPDMITNNVEVMHNQSGI